MIRHELENALLEINMNLSDKELQLFVIFATELKKWNSKVNLTAICKDSDIAVKHIIDSLIFASYVNHNDYVMDIGSGAGIPAIPLKIVKQGVKLVSVDAVGKKIMFQRHVARLLGLEGFDALHARVENLYINYAGLFDVITSRAFSSLGVFVSLAAPLLNKGGRIIAMKGSDVQTEIDNTGDELQSIGFEVCSVHKYSLPMNKGNRSIVTIKAVNAY